MRSRWAPFVTLFKLQHATYTWVSNKDVSVNRLSYSYSQETRKRRENNAVTNFSGFPCPTGFFPMLRTVHTRKACCFLEKNLGQVMNGLYLHMQPVVTDPTA